MQSLVALQLVPKKCPAEQRIELGRQIGFHRASMTFLLPTQGRRTWCIFPFFPCALPEREAMRCSWDRQRLLSEEPQ